MDRTELKETIKQQINCRQFLEKSKGGLYKCPFCGSGSGKHGTGALKLYEETNTYTCFSCHNSGDVIDLYQQTTSADYNTALQELAAMLNITVDPQEAKIMQKDSRNNSSAKPVLDLAAYYAKCEQQLQTSTEALSYLAGRGISAEVAAKYHLGYDAAADPAETGHKTPRIIIPVNASHYIGRRIDGDSHFKAMNNKGCTMGIFNAAVLANETNKEIFIVEGWADAISIELCGAAAVAINSTGNAELFINMLKNKPSTATFIISLDNDGNPNTEKAVDKLKEGLAALNAPYTEADITAGYKDANEALTGNKDALKEQIAAAVAVAKKDDLALFLDKIQTEIYKPYQTGLKFFDDMLGGGVMRQTLFLLMAAPGAGKTALCQQIAECMAASKKPVIYINLEMSYEQMLARAVSYYMFANNNHSASNCINMTAAEVLQGYKWSAEQAAAVDKTIGDYRKSNYPYIKYETQTGTNLRTILEYIDNKAKGAVSNNQEAPAIVVDYLHMITSETGQEIKDFMKDIVKGFKDYAIKYNTFVLGISATNRDSNGRISLDSGRDSSNLEYTADYVLSLDYTEVDNGNISPKTQAGKISLAAEQQKPYRNMIIRVLKSRLCSAGGSAIVHFNAAHNIFYGDKEWRPADNSCTPFDILRASAADKTTVKQRR